MCVMNYSSRSVTLYQRAIDSYQRPWFLVCFGSSIDQYMDDKEFPLGNAWIPRASVVCLPPPHPQEVSHRLTHPHTVTSSQKGGGSIT
jgi:hypothetical protein